MTLNGLNACAVTVTKTRNVRLMLVILTYLFVCYAWKFLTTSRIALALAAAYFTSKCSQSQYDEF